MSTTAVSLVAFDATNAAATAVIRADAAAETHEYERAEVWAAIGTAHAALAIAVRLHELIEMIRVIGEGIGGDLGNLTNKVGNLGTTIAEAGPR